MNQSPKKCSYIIELFRWNTKDNIYEKKDDCVMYLDPINGDFEIVAASIIKIDVPKYTTSNKTPAPCYVKANIINDNVMIISRERHNIASLYNVSFFNSNSLLPELTIDYEMIFEQNKFGIRFDSRSASSEKNFYDEFTKLRTKYECVERYAESKRIKIEGSKSSSGKYTGFCIEYYDAPGSPIKYMGEFEDGLYDGEGEFFSLSGNIRLSCKNICNGVPNGFGRMTLGRNRDIKTVKMRDFLDVRSTDAKYTNIICYKVDPGYDDITEMFKNMSLEDRTMFLFNELKKLHANNDQKSQTKSFFNLF